MKPNSTWYANLQRIGILMVSAISGNGSMIWLNTAYYVMNFSIINTESSILIIFMENSLNFDLQT